jgi:hypothetical protein
MKVKMTTPLGTVKFPNVNRPNDKGKYTLGLVLDPQETAVKNFLESLHQAIAESMYPKYDKVIKKDKDKDENDQYVENGKVLINFISSFPVKLFDAKKNEVDPEKVEVGWGSRVRVAFTLTEFNTGENKGLTKYLRGIQVIDPKGGATAESCGFEEENDGYVYGQEEEPWDADV